MVHSKYSSFLDDRPRDPIPLPLTPMESVPCSSLSRPTKQKVSRRRAIVTRMNSASRSINALFGGDPSPDSLDCPRLLTSTGTQHLQQVFSSFDPTACRDSAEEAAGALLGSSLSYSGEENTITSLASFNRALVALPGRLCPPTAALDMVDPEASKILKDCENELMLSPGFYFAKNNKEALIKPYTDPKLKHSKSEYELFISELF